MKIGVFDSGLGGLVVTKAFINALPEYDYVYYGDTEHLPYGEKTSGQILSYTIEAIKFLISQNCGLIIIACNTATSIALRYLQQRFIPSFAPDVKVLGVVIPTVEEALLDNAQKVGVVATNATVRSHIYEQELHKIKPDLEVREIAAPEPGNPDGCFHRWPEVPGSSRAAEHFRFHRQNPFEQRRGQTPRATEQ